jgi:hypothetical protein
LPALETISRLWDVRQGGPFDDFPKMTDKNLIFGLITLHPEIVCLLQALESNAWHMGFSSVEYAKNSIDAGRVIKWRMEVLVNSSNCEEVLVRVNNFLNTPLRDLPF